jgi:hypothetical protein
MDIRNDAFRRNRCGHGTSRWTKTKSVYKVQGIPDNARDTHVNKRTGEIRNSNGVISKIGIEAGGLGVRPLGSKDGTFLCSSFAWTRKVTKEEGRIQEGRRR